ASYPGGSRRRTSGPRPFAERTSQCQLIGPIAPSDRAKPVMLLMVMSAPRACRLSRAEAPPISNASTRGPKRPRTVVAEQLRNKEARWQVVSQFEIWSGFGCAFPNAEQRQFLHALEPVGRASLVFVAVTAVADQHQTRHGPSHS